MVNVADIWSKRLRSYQGRSRQRMELHQQMHRGSKLDGSRFSEVVDAKSYLKSIPEEAVGMPW